MVKVGLQGPPSEEAATVVVTGFPAICRDTGPEQTQSGSSPHLKPGAQLGAAGVIRHQGPAQAGPFHLGKRKSGREAPIFPPFDPLSFLHLPVDSPALLQLVRRLHRLGAPFCEFFLFLLLVCRRGAALGLSLIDFLLHRRRRGRGGDCVITKSMPSHQHRGEQQGERSDGSRELQWIRSDVLSSFPKRVLQSAPPDAREALHAD